MRTRDHIASVMSVLVVAVTVAAEEPTTPGAEHQRPPFEYRFERVDQGSGYTAFKLTLLSNLDDHVAFVLFSKGQRMGAFSLKPSTKTTNSVTYWLSCLRKEFLHEYGEGSAMVVSGWPLKLSEAVTQTRPRDTKKSQPDG
jgi:hypothetical protein